MKISNKDVIQSYIVTTAKYNFSIYEKRILYRLVDAFQNLNKGQKLEGKVKVNKDLFGDYLINMPIASFLSGEQDHNYVEVKKALLSLEGKSFEYEDEERWEFIRLIQNPIILKKAHDVNFRINPKIFDALLNFSKGYSKYELETAMSFQSVYSMRFYELLSNQKKAITYAVNKLKIMFKLEDKYKLTSDFIINTVDVAKKELDKKSPYSFTYKKNLKGGKIQSLTFYPLYNPENRDPTLEKRSLSREVSLAWDLDRMVVSYLKENFFFNDIEIKHNLDLFKVAQKKLDLMYELSQLKVKAMNARISPQAFIVGVLKRKVSNG